MDRRARLLELLRRHGWNATSFQALEPAFDYWFDGSGAAVAFFDTGGAWVVAGPPVAASEDLGGTAARFARHARNLGKRVAFFAVEERFLRAIGMRAVPIGQQPRWNPQTWSERHRGHRSLREQLRRARAKGLVVERFPGETIAAIRPQVERLIGRWLRARAMPPMAFLVELSPFLFAEERRYYGARIGEELQGLLVAVPVYRRDGWFFEDLLRDPTAPNGTAESLVNAAMLDVAADGATFVTLGLAPLAGDARWQRLVRRAMEGFYNFEGLRAFKAKLRPDAWDPIYLAWPGDQSAAVAVFDALDAFAGGKIIRFASRSLLRAPAAALFVLGVLAIPWALLLASVEQKRWFPSRAVQRAWVVFDLAMAGVLISLSKTWRRPLAIAACAAASADALLTTAEAASYNLRRMRGWKDAAVISVAVAAPFLVAAVLFGGLRTRR